MIDIIRAATVIVVPTLLLLRLKLDTRVQFAKPATCENLHRLEEITVILRFLCSLVNPFECLSILEDQASFSSHSRFKFTFFGPISR